MILQDDPVLKVRHLLHIGDLLSRFRCEAAKVMEVGRRSGAGDCGSPEVLPN
jgi:hypothetical protein